MKKLIVFVLSFCTLFIIFQVVSGLLVTWMYTPPQTFMSGASTVEFGMVSVPFWFSLAAAVGAFFISNRFRTRKAAY
ncbi:hypothetical protein ACTHQ4_20310 [Alkalicoccobacillus gibsonii]|uniref:hypothetical protein n=1 Tax=Alkalicoccobacillus gibsonii TaxID=79881 RepID=UPI003F7C8E2E